MKLENGINLGFLNMWKVNYKMGKIRNTFLLETIITDIQGNQSKDNQMRSPSLLYGPKIRKAYFEASNPKKIFQ